MISDIEILLRLELSNAEIAKDLNIGVRTVEKRIEILLKKFKVSNRTSLMLKAIEQGYLLVSGYSLYAVSVGPKQPIPRVIETKVICARSETKAKEIALAGVAAAYDILSVNVVDTTKPQILYSIS